MAPAWTQFESDYQKKLEIVYINVDQRDTPEFKKYAAFAPSSIPFTLWVNHKGTQLDSKVGSLSPQELNSISDKALKDAVFK